MNTKTTLGLDEPIERVLAYAVGWLSGLILFFVEKNRSVRWHAAQSIVTFATLSLLMLVVSLLKGLLHPIPVLSIVTDAGLGLLFSVLLWISIGLWLWLMLMAWLQPDYRLPIVSEFLRYLV